MEGQSIKGIKRGTRIECRAAAAIENSDKLLMLINFHYTGTSEPEPLCMCINVALYPPALFSGKQKSTRKIVRCCCDQSGSSFHRMFAANDESIVRRMRGWCNEWQSLSSSSSSSSLTSSGKREESHLLHLSCLLQSLTGRDRLTCKSTHRQRKRMV